MRYFAPITIIYLFSEAALGFASFPSWSSNKAPSPRGNNFVSDNAPRSYGFRSAGFSGGCSKVFVHCLHHYIDIDGHRSRIDCGNGGTTRSGSGTIGGRHSGPKVPDGLKINTPGMRGTTKVFHTWSGYRRDGRTYSYPRGTMPSGKDKSRGCVIVNDQVYAKLKSSCKGKRITIVGNDTNGRRMASAGGNRGYKKSRGTY